MNYRWLLRMAKWGRNPPGEKQVKLVLGAILICLVLFAIERLFGWPEWLTPQNTPRGRFNN
ncbi:hypothetical protein [Actibacterium lipolyticum]|uniref:Uncharacterized protein n=1 Tax=Actibacterium lipolyticum TaxID=1524263 RepID=A0A238JWX6_9RHOB|nr:hypothetical protein [Actibacterium lipolyticum]SMX35150.1 hypothetical protein COL8621_01674 [Actibacterium lipolyticum]